MTPRPPHLPALYVEGPDDVSVIAALLKKHGVDTRQGTEHLWIKPLGSIQALLEAMPDAIKAERAFPCGFVLDIDVELIHRWQAVRDRLQFADDPVISLADAPPTMCPVGGYSGQVMDYPAKFGVWLMPDCSTDGQVLEHLIQTLLRPGDPLWPHAVDSVGKAARIADEYNASLSANDRQYERFSDRARIKAEIRTWLAWQSEPGVPLGAAINNEYLAHDSVQALAFLRWLGQLYGFSQLSHV